MSARGTPKVYIVTWCRSAALLYGSTLVFQTLRVGFPTAEVEVIENASEPELRPAIRAAAEGAGCAFTQLEDGDNHWRLIERLTLAGAEDDRPVVFVDPDVAFWDAVEDWDFGEALMAGRYLPEFDDPFSGALTLSRLHTSHLWFPSPAALKARIVEIASQHWEAGSLFQPRMMPPGWWRWDTAAALFQALGDDTARFTEPQLDAYDHLFCGSHLDQVLPRMGPWGALMAASHQQAQADLPSVKGIWRAQEQFFGSRPWSGRVG